MKSIVTAVVVAGALVVAAADVHAMAWGSNRGRHGGGGGSDSTRGASASVPEPSTLYAVGAGLALLGGAGWYIRRRK
jgi:hypothetical protein